MECRPDLQGLGWPRSRGRQSRAARRREHLLQGRPGVGYRIRRRSADLAVQAKHDVKYLRYWYDEATGKVFCLAEAPSPEAAAAVHLEAHGLLADSIVEVKEGA